MRSLREDERDEFECVKYLIKYVITKPNIPAFKVLEAMKELETIGEKYVVSGIVTEEELSELIDLEDFKELIEKFMSILITYSNGKGKEI